MLQHTREMCAARVCSPSQASENLRSSSGRLSHPPGPDPATSLVDGYARCALDRMHSSRPTLASKIARAAPGLRSVRARRALHHIGSAAQMRVLTPARAPRACRSKSLQNRRPVLWSSRWRCFYMLGSFGGGQGHAYGLSRRDADPCLWAASPTAPSGRNDSLPFARRPPDPILFRKFALQTFRII